MFGGAGIVCGYCGRKIVLAVAELLDSGRLRGSVFISLRGPNKLLH